MALEHEVVRWVTIIRCIWTRISTAPLSWPPVEDIRTLIERAEVPVAGPYGSPCSLPILEEGLIEFNGINYNCVCTTTTSISWLHQPGCWSGRKDDDSCEAFVVDVRSEDCTDQHDHSRYSFNWKTDYKPYDLVVMLAMTALKYHLGDSVVMESKGNWHCWLYGTGYWREDPRNCAVGIYERAFPDRAPVQNILHEEDDFF